MLQSTILYFGGGGLQFGEQARAQHSADHSTIPPSLWDHKPGNVLPCL